MKPEERLFIFYEASGVPQRRTAAAALMSGIPVVAIGFATTSKKDCFCKKAGRAIALSRLKQVLAETGKVKRMLEKEMVDQVAVHDKGNCLQELRDYLEITHQWRFPEGKHGGNN